jgi:NodT family efflux transporter outer membrane factor (OMF) lipoprotein
MTGETLPSSTRRILPARWAAVLVLLPTLAGCATIRTASPNSQVTAPAAWSRVSASLAQQPTGDLSRWWERLNDSTLTGFIERARQANTDVRTARARLRQARATRDLADANRYPTVSASASGRENKNWSPSNSTGAISVAADASWEVDVFGARRLGVQAAQADLQATAADLDNLLVSLSAEVASSYVTVRSYQARLDIARRNEASQAETLQIAEWRMQAGLASEVDVAQARTNLEQTRAQLPALESSLAASGNSLAILLGQPPGSLTAVLAAPAPVPVAPAEIAVGIPADTLRQRPDVRAAELRLFAETARLGVSRAARFPTFGLSGSIGVDAVTGALTGGTSAAASLAANVLKTVFDAGRVRRQIEIQGAAQEQALVAYEATVLTALEDVENALVSLAKNRERSVTLARAAESAQNAVALARVRYTAGLIDFQTVLDTERTLLSLEDSLASNRAEGTSAVIGLYKALGGGWSPAAAASTTPKSTGAQS